MLHQFIYPIYPILLMIILLEVILIQRSHKFNFCWQESLASIGVAIGHRLTSTVFAVIPLGFYLFVWQHRLWTISLNIWTIFLLFFGVEFFYYWHHRYAHEIRWLWATHGVHHSANYFNISAASRFGWTGLLSGNFLFFLPLCWLGFHPSAIVITLGINLLYQSWIHTELIPKLGWFEWIFNTPSHHRVHHGANPEYIDHNYGGVLIIFDRLFGTFIPENSDIPIIYGLTHPLYSHNPFKIAFSEWHKLFLELKQSQNWYDRFRLTFGRPS